MDDGDVKLGMVSELEEVSTTIPLLETACERLDEGFGASRELEDVWDADDNAATEIDELCGIMELLGTAEKVEI